MVVSVRLHYVHLGLGAAHDTGALQHQLHRRKETVQLRALRAGAALSYRSPPPSAPSFPRFVFLASRTSMCTPSMKRGALLPRLGGWGPEGCLQNLRRACAMWSGDWSQFPQESLRLLNSKVETKSFLEDVKSLIFTLGSAEDGDNHMVRVACLGPYLLATTYFSKDCEIWARSSGIFFHPSKLSDNALTPEIREVILVLDTLAYHVCLLLVVSTGGNKCHIGCGLENKHQNFLKEFDKEVVYSKVVALVEPSEFFKAFRKKLQTTLKDEQILGCFMIALKASMAHCSGALDTMLTFIVKDCTDNDKATEGNQLKVSGNKKFKEGAYLEAHALYTEAISKVRFNHLLYSNRALCSLQLSRYKEVELDARRAIILSPNFEKRTPLEASAHTR
ncbi:E3 ubiquitin-protein ligase TTC3 isoform X2 [Ixodes scapularis]